MFIAAGAAHGIGIIWHALRQLGAATHRDRGPGVAGDPKRGRAGGPRSRADRGGRRRIGRGSARERAGGRSRSLARASISDRDCACPCQASTADLLGSAEGALIVEDDYDAEYRYDREPIASLQGLSPDCVVYVGTASKTLAPGLRLAWLLVPSHLVGEVAAQHEVARAMPSVLVQAAYANLLEDGTIDRHLRRSRRRYHARRNALAGALAEQLPDVRVAGASAGLHLIAWLPEGAEELAITDAAAERGVAIHALHQDCALCAPAPPALLLGYGQISEPAIPRAVRELAAAARR